MTGVQTCALPICNVRLIYASSAATYGDGETGFNDDDDALSLGQLRPLNAYGYSKLLFDQYAVRQADRDQAPPQWAGGVGKVASFGQGISMTTLQLASFTSAMANGGKLYYLQYPVAGEPYEPRLKRELPITDSLNPVRVGMETAVLAGTARRANNPDIHLMGKTGTCSEAGARLGWFAGYTDAPSKLAVVVLLRTGVKLGGGPKASEVAGKFFRNLGEQNYFAALESRSLTARAIPATATIGTLR